MLASLRSLRGPTIGALLRRMGIAAAVLVAALVVVRVVGQQISADRYHQAAIDEVNRIGPAQRLQSTVKNVQSALQLYASRSEEHTSELQSHVNLVCRLLLEKKKKKTNQSQRR